MTCTLTVDFGYNGNPKAETGSYTVPNGSYSTAYKVARPDLYRSGEPKVYDVRTNGNQGEITLATFYPGLTDVAITNSTNSCQPEPEDKYDCINGACVKEGIYSTPGLYPSLSACEQACGTGCSGKCLSNADWAKIEGLAGQLKQKNCS